MREEKHTPAISESSAIGDAFLIYMFLLSTYNNTYASRKEENFLKKVLLQLIFSKSYKKYPRMKNKKRHKLWEIKSDFLFLKNRVKNQTVYTIRR